MRTKSFKRTALTTTILAGTILAGLYTSHAQAGVKSVEFMGMSAPETQAELESTYSKAQAKVTYSDGKVETVDMNYVTLFDNTDKVGTSKAPAGTLYDAKGKPLMDPNGAPVIAETPDANSLLRLENGETYLVTHWEYDWLLQNGEIAEDVKGWHSRMPMSMSLTKIKQDPTTGRMSAVDQSNIDFSNVGGLWIPCAGSQTPWNTHLGAEEDYDLFLAKKVDGGVKAMSALYFNNEKTANPYQYGHQVEVKVNPGGTTEVTKHYAMGRASWEKARILDDGRTVYFGDDGRNVGLFMFIADRENDLSAGTIYAAKWTQISTENAGKGALSWIKLGHSTNADVENMINMEKFSSSESTIFEFSKEPKDGFKAIRAGIKKGEEHVRLNAGKEDAAAFLETRRYAAYKGATTEFNKMEGVAYDAQGGKVFIAMSYMSDGMMEDPKGPADDIRLPKINAGATFELNLAAGVKDTDGTPIASNLVAVDMAGVAELVGKDLAEMDKWGNKADPERVANPDNLFFSSKMRTLFIGEDSGLHANNYVWAFNVDTRKLSRILSVPMGAEATGLQVVDNMGGHAYIMSNHQHRGERIDVADLGLKAALEKSIDTQKASVGYLEGLPGM